MVFLDRVLLGLIALILLVCSTLLALTITGNDLFLDWLLSPNLLFDGGILAAIFFLLALYLIIMIAKREKKQFIVYERELGAVRISADSIRGLIAEAASELPGLQQVNVRITDVEQPRVILRVQVYPDYNIPQFSEELQQHVQQYVANTVGVTIEEVEVVVVGITRKDASVADSSL